MKIRLERVFVFVAIIAFLLFGVGLPKADAAVADWQKGGTIFGRWDTDFSSESFRQSVRNLRATGANYVNLHVPLYQSNVNSTDIQKGGNTPTDQALTDGINFVHSLGMKVMLKFQVLPYDGQWSAFINPSDRTTWFNNYGNFLTHYAGIAQRTGVEELVLGTELISMTSRNVNSTNTANWRSLIGKVRAVYSGKLTYSANWGESGFTNEKANIDFWDVLDYIGIAAYYNLYGDGTPQSLRAAWNNWNVNDITPLQQKWGKPIIFTEIGYKALTNSYSHPWMWWEGGGQDQAAQARAYEALFSYWNDYPFMQGVHLWNWSSDPNAGGSGDIEYTPQNKEAQSVMTKWFGSAAPTPPPPDSGTPTFKTTATMNPTAPQKGTTVSFAVNVSNSGGNVSNTVVDIEVYDASGGKVFQKFFEGQNFASGASSNYSASWTPQATGNHVLKVGVFNSTWSTNYYWGNEVLAFNVGTNSPPPPPPPPSSTGTIDVWWPTNGATISGVQPFKAMLQNADVSTYEMFWQVDNGQMNGMYTSQEDYPHKEAWVDVSGWNWRDNGPYELRFSAKNLSGGSLGASTVSINISR